MTISAHYGEMLCDEPVIQSKCWTQPTKGDELFHDTPYSCTAANNVKTMQIYAETIKYPPYSRDLYLPAFHLFGP
jgi:hypothetical protein